MLNSKKTVKELFEKKGIEINGKNNWDIQVYNEKIYSRILGGGSLALGESYMDGWWDCKRLDLFFEKLTTGRIRENLNFNLIFLVIKSKLFNMQNKIKSKEVIKKHYDLDNDLYLSFLDPNNQYTCGYFENTNNLNKAQEKKLDLICKKLQLKKTDKVLDIGCGFGGLAKYITKKYGCHVTGISISDEQIKYAKKYTKGLNVTIKKQDYRDIKGKYDKIVSVGMFEAVGHRNFRKFMKIVERSLKDDGLFLLHTIGQSRTTKSGNPWIEKYIFPNGMLPSIKQIGNAIENLLIIEDLHNFGPYYTKTLIEWEKNFKKSWPKLKKKYDQKFYRMFKYYFLFCAGIFKSRKIHLWQMVFRKEKPSDVYKSIR